MFFSPKFPDANTPVEKLVHALIVPVNSVVMFPKILYSASMLDVNVSVIPELYTTLSVCSEPEINLISDPMN